MPASFGFEALGVVVGDMFFVDPAQGAGQETPERGVRLELRLVDRAGPQGSIYAGIPIALTRPVWRVDLFGSTESQPGTLDRAHHHPRFDGWEPGRRHFVPELSADPVSWLTDQLADPAAVLTRAGGVRSMRCRCDADEVSEADKDRPRRGSPGDCRRGEADARRRSGRGIGPGSPRAGCGRPDRLALIFDRMNHERHTPATNLVTLR